MYNKELFDDIERAEWLKQLGREGYWEEDDGVVGLKPEQIKILQAPTNAQIDADIERAGKNLKPVKTKEEKIPDGTVPENKPVIHAEQAEQAEQTKLTPEEAMFRSSLRKYYRRIRNKYIQQVKRHRPDIEALFNKFEKNMYSQKNKVGSRAFVAALEKGFGGIKWEWRMQDEGPVSVQQDQLVNEGSNKVTAANTQITSGVGAGNAENIKADVMVIQKALLNLGLLSESDFEQESTVVNSSPTPTVEQEKIGKTIDAISRFQEEVLHRQSSDGNISGPDSKTLEEIHAEHMDADYVQKRIALYPTIVAQREAKAEKRKQEKLAAQKQAEQKAAEAARIKAIKDKPATKEAADKFLEQEGNTLEIADKLKEYVSLNPKFVQAVINQFDRMDRDNITFALMNRVSDTELATGGEDLVQLMRETLTNWFVSWSSYTKEIERLDNILGPEKVVEEEVSGYDINPNTLIGNSVGQGGVNLACDVKIIQLNLNLLGYLQNSEEIENVKNMPVDDIVTELPDTIKAITNYQRFGLGISPDGRIDSNGNTFNNMVSRLTMIKEYQNHTIETSPIDLVLLTSEWISQFKVGDESANYGDGRGLYDSEKARPNKSNNVCCWDAACAMVKQKGGSINHIVSSRIPMLLQQDGENMNLNGQAGLGVRYIDKQLLAGKPVLVGVDDGRTKTYNPDHTTEHFITIVGKVIKDNKVYYRFFDPGTRNGAKYGYNEDNLLFLGENNILTGEKPWNKKTTYTVSQVRQNN